MAFEHVTKWKNLSDIDYFTQYIKAWLAFNAWLRTQYPKGKKDRDAIDEIKKNNDQINIFKTRIKKLIEVNSAEGDLFRNRIADLHELLKSTEIKNHEKLISFENVYLGSNTIRDSNPIIKNNFTYQVKYIPPTQRGQIKDDLETSIKEVSGNPIFTYTQKSYDLQKLLDLTTFKDLTAIQKRELKKIYEILNPIKYENIVIGNKKDGKQLGKFFFEDDTERIAKAIIEILYELRNILFHAEVLPTERNNQIYGIAYDILKRSIETI